MQQICWQWMKKTDLLPTAQFTFPTLGQNPLSWSSTLPPDPTLAPRWIGWNLCFAATWSHWFTLMLLLATMTESVVWMIIYGNGRGALAAVWCEDWRWVTTPLTNRHWPLCAKTSAGWRWSTYRDTQTLTTYNVCITWIFCSHKSPISGIFGWFKSDFVSHIIIWLAGSYQS